MDTSMTQDDLIINDSFISDIDRKLKEAYDQEKKLRNQYDNIKENYSYEIKDNKKIYYINDESSINSKIPLLEYIENIKKSAEYAGDLELSMTAINYDITIYVYTSLNDNYYQLYYIFGQEKQISEENIKDILFIAFNNDNHYDIFLCNIFGSLSVIL